MKLPLPKAIDPASFEPNLANPATKYGLPETVNFCKRCVISNQRPNSTIEFQHVPSSKKSTINFDEEAICDACRVAERKHLEIDWDERERELRAVCDEYRKDNGEYDCLVPGSGGKDSFYAAHVLKNSYGMHPLTVTWAPHIYTDWGWRNQQAWIHAGFDNLLVTPNGRTHRLLTRLAVEKLFHPFQPFILGQKNLAPQIARRYKIPLVFFGENEAEYGNPVADMGRPKRDASYFTADESSEFYFGGVSAESLVADFGLDRCDLQPYLPEKNDQAASEELDVRYLGYYLKWHPQSAYYYAVEHGGFEASPERTPGTYSKYNSIDDKIDDLHYYTTHIKFGIGRATYDAAQEIRSGDITREEGVALVRRFDGEFPDRFADEIFEYLSIDPATFPVASQMFEQPIMDLDYFHSLADMFRSPHLWSFANGTWSLRQTVWGIDAYEEKKAG